MAANNRWVNCKTSGIGLATDFLFSQTVGVFSTNFFSSTTMNGHLNWTMETSLASSFFCTFDYLHERREIG